MLVPTDSCPSRNGILHSISALVGRFEFSKYSVYVTGSNPSPALNSGASYPFWTGTNFEQTGPGRDHEYIASL